MLALVATWLLSVPALASHELGAELAQTRAEAWTHYTHRDYERFVVLLEGVRAQVATTKDLYNLACGYALTGQHDRALETLGEVIARGATVDLLADPDLASLYGRPEFEGLVERAVYARTLTEKLERARAKAQALHAAGEYEAFVEVMRTVAQLTNREEDRYNLACGYALVGRVEAALDVLEGLARTGAPLDPFADDDFARLRHEPRFLAVADRMAAIADPSCSDGPHSLDDLRIRSNAPG